VVAELLGERARRNEGRRDPRAERRRRLHRLGAPASEQLGDLRRRPRGPQARPGRGPDRAVRCPGASTRPRAQGWRWRQRVARPRAAPRTTRRSGASRHPATSSSARGSPAHPAPRRPRSLHGAASPSPGLSSEGCAPGALRRPAASATGPASPRSPSRESCDDVELATAASRSNEVDCPQRAAAPRRAHPPCRASRLASGRASDSSKGGRSAAASAPRCRRS